MQLVNTSTRLHPFRLADETAGFIHNYKTFVGVYQTAKFESFSY